MSVIGQEPSPNLYRMPEFDAVGTQKDPTGRRRAYPVIDGSTGVFVTIGQSRIANNSGPPATPYTPSNGVKCLNLNPYDGNFYVLKDPVIGCSATDGYYQAGWQGRFCDKLLLPTAKYSQLVILPIAVAGSSITQWVPGTGSLNPRILAACNLLTGLGITPTAWLIQIGTTDNINGMAQATFAAHLRSVIAYQRSLPGRSADKWMIAQDTIYGGSTSAGIRAAQASVATDANNYLGPDCDTIDPGAYDGTHYNDTGNNYIAGLWDTRVRTLL